MKAIDCKKCRSNIHKEEKELFLKSQYAMMKDLEAAYIYPPVKEAYATAARRIDQMIGADILPVGGWISVNDRLPEKEQKVLVFYKAIGEKNRIHNDVIATNWRKSNGDFIPCRDYEITHWMPLPEPPKDGDTE